MPAGSMPGPPESGSDEPPLAGTAPAPSVGVTGDVPYVSEIGPVLIKSGRLSI